MSRVSRIYEGGESPVAALRDIDLSLEEHDFATITGPSGCGKSTLLNLLGALDTPSSGEISVGGFELHAADERQRTRYRRREVGIIFQFFNLLPGMNLEENVVLPLLLDGHPRKTAEAQAREKLELVGLTHRRRHFVHEVSGGEIQRAAIARALVHKPRLLLADEPTGNLDSRNSEKILDLFRSIHKEKLATLIVVTHNRSIAAAAPTRIRMRDGRIETREGRGAPLDNGVS